MLDGKDWQGFIDLFTDDGVYWMPASPEQTTGDGAPSGTRVLQFLPSQDGRLVTCLWESTSVANVQSYVDETLADTSVNLCYAVEESAAFAEAPAGIAQRPAVAVA